METSSWRARIEETWIRLYRDVQKRAASATLPYRPIHHRPSRLRRRRPRHGLGGPRHGIDRDHPPCAGGPRHLQSSRPEASPASAQNPPKKWDGLDRNGHGTHVAGIIAGSFQPPPPARPFLASLRSAISSATKCSTIPAPAPTPRSSRPSTTSLKPTSVHRSRHSRRQPQPRRAF